MSRKFSVLTRTALKKLPCGGTLREHGIIAERLPDGDIRFSVNVMVDRQRIHRVVGRESDRITRYQAEQVIEALRTQAREGRLRLPRGRKVNQTFAEASKDYLCRIEHHPKHGRNLQRKRQHFRERLTPWFKACNIDQITDLQIAEYIQSRKTEGAAQATVNRELSSLSHFLSRCVEWGWATRKPVVPKGQEARKQITVLSETEKQALLRAATQDQDPLTWLFVAIAMLTAMRHGEILRMKWTDIDFAARRIHIAQAKAGQREQPMPNTLADRLKEEWQQLGKPQGHLFPTSRADAIRPHRESMATQFRRAVERAKLDPAKVTPHILRHTAITELVKLRVDLPTIQKISGHKTLEMVLRYTQLSDAHVTESVAKLDIAIPESLTPKLHAGCRPD